MLDISLTILESQSVKIQETVRFKKKKIRLHARSVVHLVECVTNTHKALDLIPSIAQTGHT